MGSPTDATLSPSTGLSSLPVSVPSYTKVRVVLAPFLMGLGKRDADGRVGAPLSVERVVLRIGHAIHLERVVQFKDRGAVVSVAVKVTRAVAFRVWSAGSSWASIT